MNPHRVAVLGTGPIALGSAAVLLSRGHQVVAWSPRGTVPHGRSRLTAAGALAVEGAIEVAGTCAEAVGGASAVLLAVPANAYRSSLEALAACLRPAQPAIISGHLSFGALFLSKLLADRGVAAPIVAWGTTLVSGRLLAPGSVQLSSVRAEVDLATVPGAQGEPMLDLCRILFGDRFHLRRGLVAVMLSNANPQNHLAIALCNVTRMEKGEAWRQYANITPAVGRFMEALDAERLAIAREFGVEVRTLRRHLHLSFHIPEGPVAEMAASLAAGTNDPIAPNTLETRYVLEDAPFGLYPTVLLGEMCGRPARLHEAGLQLLSALYGRDMAAENDLVPLLNLEETTASELSRISDTGWDGN